MKALVKVTFKALACLHLPIIPVRIKIVNI